MRNGARVKGSFREADAPAAGKVRAFVDRRQRASERGDAASTAEIAALLDGLDGAMGETPDGRGGVLADESALRRRALSLRVRFEAVATMEQRALAGDEAAPEPDVTAVVLAILCTELHRDLCALATEALGYYALPMPPERPGDNEAPLGGAYARSARKGMLAGLFVSGGTLDERRDRLARRLLEARDTGESG